MGTQKSTERFDAVILGAGPGGEVVAGRLAKAGKKIALVERELIGGECSYWACIPSKTLLHPAELRASVARSFGLSVPETDWKEIVAYRDRMIRHLDDSKEAAGYEDQGVSVVKAVGRLVERGVVEAGGRYLEAGDIVVATGSDNFVPPVEGLAETGFWANREATTLKRVPESVICIGGGAVACELGQMMHRYGAKVTIVERSEHLLGNEEPRLGQALGRAFEAEGIKLCLGASAEAVRREGDKKVVQLGDGEELRAEEILVATGRRPRLKGLGLEVYGLEPERALEVDEYGRAADGLWGVGDVTGVALFTHVAKYQGRVVAANILGRSWKLDYRAIPRVVFTDPRSGAVGETTQTARDKDLDFEVAHVTFDSIARPWTMEPDPSGELGLLVQKGTGTVLGAWACGADAGEWIHVAALAVKLNLSVETLVDSIYQFPTLHELYVSAAEEALGQAP